MDAKSMNEAVSRIAGVSRKVFEDKDKTPESDTSFSRGEPKNNDGKEGGSLAQKVPGHRMPPTRPKGDVDGAEDIDNEPETVAPVPKAESVNKRRKAKKQEESSMSLAKSIGMSSMTEWRNLSGLSSIYEGETGEVPTSGVNKENPRRGGGLPGLEGQAVQDIEPSEYGDDGEDEEETFDPNPGDLKKEDYDAAFASYLESKGISPELFHQLIDEAEQGEDLAEMEELLRVEDHFRAQLQEGMKWHQAGDQKPDEEEEGFELECDGDENGEPAWGAALGRLTGNQ